MGIQEWRLSQRAYQALDIDTNEQDCEEELGLEAGSRQ